VGKKEKCLRLFYSGVLILIFLMLSGTIKSASTSAPEAPQKKSAIPHKKNTYAKTKQNISSVISKKMRKRNIMGLSIALVDDQQIVWAEGFGYADKANKKPAAPETVYMVGSISRLFTGIAVMQLAEQGKIDIDRPLKTYLPEFSIKTRYADAGPITPRSVMTHHSGLPITFMKGMWTRNPARLPELRKGYTRLVHKITDEYTTSPPNFIFSYSELGMSLLGHMVEKVSGKDFVSYMDESVLGPIGMTHSSFWPTTSINTLLSKVYKKGKEIRPTFNRDLPAASLHSNVLDMSRFMMMVFANGKVGERQILRPETMAEMLRPQNSKVPLDFNLRIGLIWMLNRTGRQLDYAGTAALQDGSIGEFRSMLIILPEHKLGVVLLANSPPISSLLYIAVRALRSAVEEKTGLTPPKPKPSPIVSLSNEELRTWEGRYASILGIVSFRVKGKYLQGSLKGNSFRLLPHADGTFSPRYLLFGFIPIKVSVMQNMRLSFAEIEGRKVVTLYSYGMFKGIGEKIQPGSASIPRAWLNRLGAYEIMNAGDDELFFKNIKLRYNSGLLIFDATILMAKNLKASVALAPVSDTEAVIRGLGSFMGETIRVTTVDGKEKLLFSGYEFRRKTD
jgi:CubicO group peptidase (beta-lactamase class C family)